MNYKISGLAVLAALSLIGCTREVLVQDAPVNEEQDFQSNQPAIVSGEFNVLFSDEMIELIEADLDEENLVTKSSELNSLTESLGVTSISRVFPYAGKFEARTRAEGLHKWYKVKYDSSIPPTKASDELASLPGVDFIEEVRAVRNTAIFNDPEFSYQWHYYNDGSLEKSHVPGADVNVMTVWNNYTTGNPDVIVAVVDGGIDIEHEDLAENYAGGYNFVQESTKITAHNHGTHVAGTIAAVNNNGKGVVGVAGGNAAVGQKGVRLLSCQIFEHNPDDPSKDLSAGGAGAIKWGADNGAVISQNSWGLVYETAEEQANATIPGTVKSAIDYFIKYAGYDENGRQVGPMAGGVVIFAAGNDARADDPICKYDPVISVGAIAPDFTRTDYSNYGDWVDLAAPGGSGHYAYGQVLSTLPGNKYGYLQGTSMACPHVSGVAALVVSHLGGKGFTNTELRERLINGANTKALSKNAKIGVLVDALGAMTYGSKQAPKPVSSVTCEVISNSIAFRWNATSDPDDVVAYGYKVLVSDNKDAVLNSDPKTPSQGVQTVDVLTGQLKVGEELSGSVSGLEFNRDYYIVVAAYDYAGNYSSKSEVFTVRTDKNNPPLISTDYQGSYVVKAHKALTVTYNIEDPDGHKFNVDFTAGSPAAVFTKTSDSEYKFTIIGNAADHGKYKATISVTDSYGETSEETIDYEILENHAPVVVKDIEDQFFDKPGQQFTIDMMEYLNDPDGETLNFQISTSDKKILHINPSANILHVTTLGYGLSDVSIVASDSRGLNCILTFKVLVKDPANPLSLYPNPVTDWLNVATMDAEPTTITIVSSTGKVIYDEISEVSAFEPARIDMSTCAPGQYAVSVSFGGNEYKRTIVKL